LTSLRPTWPRGGPKVEPDDGTSDKVLCADLLEPDRNVVTVVQVGEGVDLRSVQTRAED
jgi:hypothetical protein